MIATMAPTAPLALAAVTLLNCFFAASVIVYTDNRSWTRLPAVLIVGYLGYLEILAAFDFNSSLIYSGVAAGFLFSKCIHLVNLLWVNAIDGRDLAPNPRAKSI